MSKSNKETPLSTINSIDRLVEVMEKDISQLLSNLHNKIADHWWENPVEASLNLERIHHRLHLFGQELLQYLFKLDALELTESSQSLRPLRKALIKRISTLADLIEKEEKYLFNLRNEVDAVAKKQKQRQLKKEPHYSEQIINDRNEDTSEKLSKKHIYPKYTRSQKNYPSTPAKPDISEESQLSNDLLSVNRDVEEINKFWWSLSVLPEIKFVDLDTHYCISLHHHSIVNDSLSLSLQKSHPDGDLWRLTGLAAPSSAEERREFKNTLDRVVKKRQREKSMKLNTGERGSKGRMSLEDEIWEEIGNLSMGKYGSFSEDFILPVDANMSESTMTCDGEVVEITIPKKKSGQNVGRGSFSGRRDDSEREGERGTKRQGARERERERERGLLTRDNGKPTKYTDSRQPYYSNLSTNKSNMTNNANSLTTPSYTDNDHYYTPTDNSYNPNNSNINNTNNYYNDYPNNTADSLYKKRNSSFDEGITPSAPHLSYHTVSQAPSHSHSPYKSPYKTSTGIHNTSHSNDSYTPQQHPSTTTNTVYTPSRPSRPFSYNTPPQKDKYDSLANNTPSVSSQKSSTYAYTPNTKHTFRSSRHPTDDAVSNKIRENEKETGEKKKKKWWKFLSRN